MHFKTIAGLSCLALTTSLAAADVRARLTVTNHANPEWNYITVRFNNTLDILENPLLTVDPVGGGESVVRINHIGEYIDTEWPRDMFVPDGETFVAEFDTGSEDVSIQSGWLRRNGTDVGSFNGSGEITSPNGRPAGTLDLSLEVVSGCPADIDGDGDADSEDFFAYLDLFGAGDAAADLDGDGDIDADDFFTYLDLFASGC